MRYLHRLQALSYMVIMGSVNKIGCGFRYEIKNHNTEESAMKTRSLLDITSCHTEVTLNSSLLPKDGQFVAFCFLNLGWSLNPYEGTDSQTHSLHYLIWQSMTVEDSKSRLQHLWDIQEDDKKLLARSVRE